MLRCADIVCIGRRDAKSAAPAQQIGRNRRPLVYRRQKIRARQNDIGTAGCPVRAGDYYVSCKDRSQAGSPKISRSFSGMGGLIKKPLAPNASALWRSVSSSEEVSIITGILLKDG